MIFHREDVSYLPPTFSRVEIELRHDHCPVEYLSQLPEVVEHRPFRNIQFLEVPAYYDYKADLKNSLKRRLYHALKDDLGSQDSINIFNADRHFSRDFKNLHVDNAALKAQIEENHAATIRRFFENKCCDIPSVYKEQPLEVVAC